MISISKIIEGFTRNRLYVDLLCGFAASIVTSAFFWFVRLSSAWEMSASLFIRINVRSILISVASYLLVALMLNKYWPQLLRSIIPTWATIPLLGTLIFFAIEFVPLSMNYADRPSLGTFGIVYAFICVITLPVTGLIYYSSNIIRKLKGWHEAKYQSLDLTSNR